MNFCDDSGGGSSLYDPILNISKIKVCVCVCGGGGGGVTIVY